MSSTIIPFITNFDFFQTTSHENEIAHKSGGTKVIDTVGQPVSDIVYGRIKFGVYCRNAQHIVETIFIPDLFEIFLDLETLPYHHANDLGALVGAGELDGLSHFAHFAD